MPQRHISKDLEGHREGGQQIVDSVLGLGKDSQLFAAGAEQHLINGGVFCEFEFFEEEGIGKGADAVELNHTVLSADSEHVALVVDVGA